jgi:hypothetical protein
MAIPPMAQPEMIPGAVGHNYSEDHQSAPRAWRSRAPHITGCIECEAVSLPI